MKSDLKQRLTGSIISIAVLFPIVGINYAQAERFYLYQDSIRRVEIKVTAKEKTENYDSIFQHSSPQAVKQIEKKPVRLHASAKPAYKKLPAASTSKINSLKTMGKIISPQKDINKTEENSTAEGEPAAADTAAALSARENNSLNSRTPAQAEIFGQIPSSREETAAYPSKGPAAGKISYLWIGFVLMMGGIVLGLIFGRAAFMVSVVGIIFLIIGFYVGR